MHSAERLPVPNPSSFAVPRIRDGAKKKAGVREYCLVFPHTGLLFIKPPETHHKDESNCPVISRPMFTKVIQTHCMTSMAFVREPLYRTPDRWQ